MSKPGRNDPCPCGSGRKYKKCCLAKEKVATGERRRLHHEGQTRLERERAEADARYRDKVADGWTPAAPSTPVWVFEDDPLDDLSNSVPALIRDEKFDEALRVCDRLLADFPEVIDGLSRRARVYEAMREHAKAAEFYQRCLDFIDRPEQRDGFEDASIARYEGKLAEMRELARRD